MNKAIKYHVLFLFLIFGLFSSIEAMEHAKLPPEKQQTTQERMMAQLMVFKQKFSAGFSWIMKKIQLFYQSWFGRSWKNLPNAIYFYTGDKPYYEFTNFYESSKSPNQFTINNLPWRTVEQYYQAQKFKDHPNIQEKIRSFTSDKQRSAGGKALDFAQQNKASVRKDWLNVSINVMLTAVRAKFNQNDYLYEKLMGTGNKILIEDSPIDALYGRGSNFKGENHLGRILMHVRDELKQKKELPYDPATTYKLVQ